MGKAFIVGGLVALAACGAVAVLVMMAGGRAWATGGGAVLLFVVGGVAGLTVRAVYDKGRRDAGGIR